MNNFFIKVRSSDESIRVSRHLFWTCLELDDDDCVTMAYIFRSIGMLTNLRVLWLNRNQIGERGMLALCDVWRQDRLLPNMRSLNLGWNHFGDRATVALASVPLPCLNLLNIPDIGLTADGEGMKAIANARGTTFAKGFVCIT